MKYFYTLLFLALGLGNCFAQKQGNQWYFGNYAGLDFNSGTPVAILTGQLFTSEGSASIADKNTGNLLFYTDGTYCWDNTNNYMPNGFGMGGNSSTTQSAVIVPIPGSNTQYYVFTADAQAGDLGTGDSGVNYNIVDMTLNGGLGDVSTLDVPLLTPTAEKIAATLASNGTDIWVVVHQWNTNNFYAYKITSSGISAPVISSTAIIHEDVGSGLAGEAIGYMKISPDGSKLALACWVDLNTVQIFDFNNTTGVVSNPITDTNYPNASGYDGPYGVSFSPDNSRLYIGYLVEPGASQIFQYNMQAGSPSAIIASRTTVASDPNYVYGALQIGPDGKMYVAKATIDSLDVIENPNGLGAACNYVHNGIYLGTGQSFIGLPDMIEQYLLPPYLATLTYPGCKVNSSLSFSDSSLVGDVSYLWNFGDSSSGTADTSTLKDPTHNYSSGGSYTVMLIFNAQNKSDTFSEVVSVDSSQAINIVPQSPVVCSGQSVTLTASGGNTYTWSPETGLSATTGDRVVASPTLTVTYTVSSSSGGCPGSGTDVVHVIPSPNTPTFYQHGDTLISSSLHDNQWYLNDTLLFNDTSRYLIITRTGEYLVNVLNEANGCSTSSDSTNITQVTGINQLSVISNQLSIYPNPFNCNLFIKINYSVSDVGDWTMEFTDVLGRTLYSMPSLNYSNEIDLSNLSNGVYFITVVTKAGRAVMPVVKQ